MPADGLPQASHMTSAECLEFVWPWRFAYLGHFGHMHFGLTLHCRLSASKMPRRHLPDP
jgi:hypothetical protein